MTLADLRTLLTMAHGPAVERLEDRTPEGVARVYLPHAVYVPGDAWAARHSVYMPVALGSSSYQRALIDLTEPGTVHALKVALALALGLDPTNGVKWTRNGADNAWILDASDWCAFVSADLLARVHVPRRGIAADGVAAEPDAIKALVLACQHVARGAALTSPPSPE